MYLYCYGIARIFFVNISTALAFTFIIFANNCVLLEWMHYFIKFFVHNYSTMTTLRWTLYLLRRLLILGFLHRSFNTLLFVEQLWLTLIVLFIKSHCWPKIKGFWYQSSIGIFSFKISYFFVLPRRFSWYLWTLTSVTNMSQWLH